VVVTATWLLFGFTLVLIIYRCSECVHEMIFIFYELPPPSDSLQNVRSRELPMDENSGEFSFSASRCHPLGLLFSRA